MIVYFLMEKEEEVPPEVVQVFRNVEDALDARYECEQDALSDQLGFTYHVYEWEVD